MHEPSPQPAVERLEASTTPELSGGVENVSTTVAMRLAEAEGVDPVDLQWPLHDWFDPEALDDLVSSMTGGSVVLDVGSYQVFVFADGSVSVEPLD